MRIIYYRGEEIIKTRALYEKIFQDGELFTDYFFHKAEREATAIVLKNQDDVSMAQLYVLPKLLNYDDKIVEAAYIYGVCTDEEFRGQGFMKKLMKEAEKYCILQGRELIYLIPEIEKLYTGIGYQTVKYGDVIHYELSGKEAGMMLKFNLEPAGESSLTNDIYEEINTMEEEILEREEIIPFRDKEYFEERRRRAKAEGGDIFLLRKRNDYTIAGIIITGDEHGEIVIQDVIGEQDKKEGFIKDFMRWKGTVAMKEYVYTVMVKVISPELKLAEGYKMMVNDLV